MKALIEKLKTREEGQGMTEYILIVALLAILSIGVWQLFGNQLREFVNHATDEVAGQGGTMNSQYADDADDEVEKDLGTDF